MEETKNKRVRLTSERVNSYGFRVLTAGIDLTQYEKNPVLLYMHERGNVIGIVKDIRREGDELTGELFFDEASEQSRVCKRQWEVGSLRMVSIKFNIIEVSDAPELLVPGQTRATVTKCALFEVSLVDVGANDDAIRLMKDGVEINLEAGDVCPLPLLNNAGGEAPGTVTNPQNNKEMKDEERIALAALLNLPADADAAALTGAITQLQAEASTSAQLRAENETLKLAGVQALVATAIKEKRLTEDKRSQFEELGKKIGSEELSKILDAMHPQVKLGDMERQLSGGAGGETADGPWAQRQKEIRQLYYKG